MKITQQIWIYPLKSIPLQQKISFPLKSVSFPKNDNLCTFCLHAKGGTEKTWRFFRWWLSSVRIIPCWQRFWMKSGLPRFRYYTPHFSNRSLPMNLTRPQTRPNLMRKSDKLVWENVSTTYGGDFANRKVLWKRVGNADICHMYLSKCEKCIC